MSEVVLCTIGLSIRCLVTTVTAVNKIIMVKGRERRQRLLHTGESGKDGANVQDLDRLEKRREKEHVQIMRERELVED